MQWDDNDKKRRIKKIASKSVETGEDEDETIREGSSPKSPEYYSDSGFQMKPSTSTSGTATILLTYNISEIVDKSKVLRTVNVTFEEDGAASTVVCVGIGYYIKKM